MFLFCTLLQKKSGQKAAAAAMGCIRCQCPVNRSWPGALQVNRQSAQVDEGAPHNPGDAEARHPDWKDQGNCRPGKRGARPGLPGDRIFDQVLGFHIDQRGWHWGTEDAIKCAHAGRCFQHPCSNCTVFCTFSVLPGDWSRWHATTSAELGGTKRGWRTVASVVFLFFDVFFAKARTFRAMTMIKNSYMITHMVYVRIFVYMYLYMCLMCVCVVIKYTYMCICYKHMHTYMYIYTHTLH